MKVAIVYDRANKIGGAERVLLALNKIFPDAPLFTSVYDPKKAKWAKVFKKIHTSFLQKIPFAKNNHEFFAPLMPLAFSLFSMNDFDLVISVTSEFAKNINVKKGLHVCYCLTPTRYLWSGKNEYFKNKTIQKILHPLISYLCSLDQKAAKKPDIMIAISEEVQKRIKKYYKRDSIVIFPPSIDWNKHARSNKPPAITVKFKSNYYLIVSRLVSYKKIDLAVKTFNKLGLPLIIVGTGREANYLKKIARQNINFVGEVPDEKLFWYYKYAKALIFPQKEDFGLVAVEAQSLGTPVIAYKAGGALDILKEGIGGIFFNRQTIGSLTKAVKKTRKMKFDKTKMVQSVKRFQEERFIKNFLQTINSI
jgi:glycosyltransferase involved in cell wall biosynthesis